MSRDGVGELGRSEVARLLVAAGAVELRVDPADWFTWSSGKQAPIYCDNRILMAFPAARERIADALSAAIARDFPGAQVIAGTATAGIPHAAWVAERSGLPMAYVRGAAKEHGRGRRVEGCRLDGKSVVVLEDLISFGGSSLAAVEGVRGEGGRVLGVQAIFSYGFPEAKRRFEESGVSARSLSDYDALLEILDLSPEQTRVLLDWRGH